MTHDRAAFLAFNRAIRRAADDYYAHPSAFNDPAYCSACIRIPRAANHCDTCDARLRMQKRRAA